MNYRVYIRPALYTVVCLLFLTYFVKNVIMDNPVFGPPTMTEATVSWDQYLVDRYKRNTKAMNLSYDELIEIGDKYVAEEDWDNAMDYYFDAKTIFPERILARRGLCYVLLKQCQDHRNYCKLAKREVYYAAQYLKGVDLQNRLYIEDLVSLTGLTEIVEMEEGKALSSIF